MGNDGINKLNGNDRRKGKERRKSDRRDSNRQPQEGVLTTRAGDRRRKPRRVADQTSSKKTGKGDV
jgi:hypothetical protein